MKTNKKINISKVKVIDGELIKNDETKMLCPMKHISGQFGECDKYSCHWWDVQYNQCTIKNLGDIARTLNDK